LFVILAGLEELMMKTDDSDIATSLSHNINFATDFLDFFFLNGRKTLMLNILDSLVPSNIGLALRRSSFRANNMSRFEKELRI
jgi:hypothetical protein